MTDNDHSSEFFDDDTAASTMPPAGTLVIRTWYERERAPGFRARVTYSGVPGDEPGVVASADPDEVLTIVRQWLSDQAVPPSAA